MSNSLPSCLIITNNELLGLSLTRVARAAVGQDAPVFSITYAESLALLTPQRIRETDFFILELFRDYPGGRRAEGVVLAKRWMYRKSFLIVSPLHVSQQIQCPGYWDTEAKDSLVDRIHQIMSTPRYCNEGFDRMKERFMRMLELPPQH